MSLSIDVDEVREVLLADGWHRAGDGLYLDAYEFMEDGELVHGTGVGFALRDAADGILIAGPLTSILAVRYGDVPAGQERGDGQ